MDTRTRGTTPAKRRTGTEKSTRRTRTEKSYGSDPDSLRAQGLRTRNEIVRAAKELLLENGSLDFTLRSVARRVGISISNLQYYFPTRPAVLRAVMEPLIAGYLDELKEALNEGAPARETLDALVGRAFQDAKNAEFTPLWLHFASLAATDRECAQQLDEWYEAVTRGIARLIEAVRPDLERNQALHLATLIIAMSDGLAFRAATGNRDYTRGLETPFAESSRLLLERGLRTQKVGR